MGSLYRPWPPGHLLFFCLGVGGLGLLDTSLFFFVWGLGGLGLLISSRVGWGVGGLGLLISRLLCTIYKRRLTHNNHRLLHSEVLKQIGRHRPGTDFASSSVRHARARTTEVLISVRPTPRRLRTFSAEFQPLV